MPISAIQRQVIHANSPQLCDSFMTSMKFSYSKRADITVKDYHVNTVTPSHMVTSHTGPTGSCCPVVQISDRLPYWESPVSLTDNCQWGQVMIFLLSSAHNTTYLFCLPHLHPSSRLTDSEIVGTGSDGGGCEVQGVQRAWSLFLHGNVTIHKDGWQKCPSKIHTPCVHYV